jgi:squalene-hopene/tetraprenyl-beta-curcumene cyclase
MIDLQELSAAYEKACGDLLAQRVAEGHWVGELSSSALSTATAISALGIAAQHSSDERRRPLCLPLIARGLDWLVRHQNTDGGWGDTDKSLSNIATTMLVQAALHLAGESERHAEMLGRAKQYIDFQGGLDGLRRRYGKDKTFAVPILTNYALAGLVPWSAVSPLPFELACLPHVVLRFLRLPVVSYAVPALVAIGQARYFHGRPRNPLTRLIRRLSISGSLKLLHNMQPASGGYIEAAPLTSFVVMSLAATGRADHPVVQKGVTFLLSSCREDGSWPIDTNLATWNTTLAINALAAFESVYSNFSPRPLGEGQGVRASSEVPREIGQFLKISPHPNPLPKGEGTSFENPFPPLLNWLLSCQHERLHPYTHAAPGGWGWSDLSGAVPDVDDTSGALVALAALHRQAAPSDRQRIVAAAAAGVNWLLDIQNADGGWPTFCRGWGTMPFDRSGADLTAHAMRALHAWQQAMGTETNHRIDAAIARGLKFLARQQREDGSWIPLWFGNQWQLDEANPWHGTSRVLLAYRDLGLLAEGPARRGLTYLASTSNPDGGWGGGNCSSSQGSPTAVSTIEETALVLEAFLADPADDTQVVIDKGLRWLISAVAEDRHRETAPIGFYFAKLWYYERTYPLCFTVAALGQAMRCRRRQEPEAGRQESEDRSQE